MCSTASTAALLAPGPACLQRAGSLQALIHSPPQLDREHLLPGPTDPLHQLYQELRALGADVPRALHLQHLERRKESGT